MTTSKLIILFSWISALVLTIVVILGSFIGIDTSNITTITSLAWGELTAAHAFYYWKSKNENRSKHAMKLVKSLATEYGIDAVTNLASVILQE